MAPLRILSFDIECQGRKGYFPEAERDPVIQIANSLSVYGDERNGGPIVQNVFTLKGCLPIVGAQVISSNTEEDMLLKWRTFVHASDADIFTGYNVQAIIARALMSSSPCYSVSLEFLSLLSLIYIFDGVYVELRHPVLARPCGSTVDEEGPQTANLHPVGAS